MGYLLSSEKLKTILEQSATNDRFNGKQLYRAANPIITSLEDCASIVSNINAKLGKSDYGYMITSLLRSVFFIELVNDEISSTKMEVRWIEKESRGKKQERFDESDPRFANFPECETILFELLKKLNDSLVDPENIEIVKICRIRRLIPYEIPLDYTTSLATNTSLKQIHHVDNIDWFWDEKYKKMIKLRDSLMDEKRNKLSGLFTKILKDKVKVKTYLTDRVQTGNYKTNREKRWEVHPQSVHFALRKDCLEIETRLMNQLCHFKDFPEDLYDLFLKENIITKEEKPCRCPITLEPLDFNEFEKEINEPEHGKSCFQVGHLNPLKLSSADSSSGHVVENVKWFSDDGNRIQGSLSLNQTRDLLKRIQKNYSKLGL